jgi:hypothetical protein
VPNEVEEDEMFAGGSGNYDMAAFLKLDQQQSKDELPYRSIRPVSGQSVVPCDRGTAGVSESFSCLKGGGQGRGKAAFR